MINNYDINVEEHKWTIYIDNMALIQRMEGYTAQIPIPRWNLRSDEYITRLAHTLLIDIPAHLSHIHSHQDDNEDWHNLSFPVQLNTMADEQATHHRQLMEAPASEVINNSKAQLRIGDIAITRDSQREIPRTTG
jgi:hypothetical protein